jgi:hypothetical protein
MMRISCAVPASARISAGSGRCLARSQALARLHGARSNSGENRPPTLALNSTNEKYMMISASRKFGTAMPTKPMAVNM